MTKQNRAVLTGLSIMTIAAAGLLLLLLLLDTSNGFTKASTFIIGGEYLGQDGVVMQTKQNNCGPSALKMIFDHYKIASSLDEIEKAVHLTKSGSTMRSLKELAESKGLKAAGWKLTMKDFIASPVPSLLFVHDDHFIVVDSVVGNSVFIRDPAIGKIKMTERKLQEIWKGETLIFSLK